MESVVGHQGGIGIRDRLWKHVHVDARLDHSYESHDHRWEGKFQHLVSCMQVGECSFRQGLAGSTVNASNHIMSGECTQRKERGREGAFVSLLKEFARSPSEHEGTRAVHLPLRCSWRWWCWCWCCNHCCCCQCCYCCCYCYSSTHKITVPSGLFREETKRPDVFCLSRGPLGRLRRQDLNTACSMHGRRKTQATQQQQYCLQEASAALAIRGVFITKTRRECNSGSKVSQN